MTIAVTVNRRAIASLPVTGWIARTVKRLVAALSTGTTSDAGSNVKLQLPPSSLAERDARTCPCPVCFKRTWNSALAWPCACRRFELDGKPARLANLQNQIHPGGRGGVVTIWTP